MYNKKSWQVNAPVSLGKSMCFSLVCFVSWDRRRTKSSEERQTPSSFLVFRTNRLWRVRWSLGGLILTWTTQGRAQFLFLIVFFSNPGSNWRDQSEFGGLHFLLCLHPSLQSTPSQHQTWHSSYNNCPSCRGQHLWQAWLAWGARRFPQADTSVRCGLSEFKGLCGMLKACQSVGCSGCAGLGDEAATLGRGCCHLGGDWWWESAELLLDSPAVAPPLPLPLYQSGLRKGRGN